MRRIVIVNNNVIPLNENDLNQTVKQFFEKYSPETMIVMYIKPKQNPDKNNEKPNSSENNIYTPDNINSLQNIIGKLENYINNITNNTNSGYIDSISRNINNFCNEIDQLKLRYEKELSDRNNNLNNEFNKHEEKLNNLCSEIKNKIDNWDPLRTKSSHDNGESGEELIYNMLNEILRDQMDVERVGEINHIGDIHVRDNLTKTLYVIECKNYKSTVQKDQIKKFKNDMENIRTHNNYQEFNTIVGIFLSIGSGGITGGKLIDVDEDGDIYLTKDFINRSTLELLIKSFQKYFLNKLNLTGKLGNDESNKINLDYDLFSKLYSDLTETSGLIKIFKNNLKCADYIIKSTKEYLEKLESREKLLESFGKWINDNKLSDKIITVKQTVVKNKIPSIVKKEERNNVQRGNKVNTIVNGSSSNINTNNLTNTNQINSKNKKLIMIE